MDKYLLSNTTYKYVVKAVDVAGNESVQSDIFIITTKLKAFHMKNGMQRKHMKREIEFYTREKYMKQSKVIKEMGSKLDLCLIIMENSVSFTLV